MANVGGTGSSDQIQNVSFSVDAESVNPEEGYLNGSKVTVQAIDPEEFVGIEVSANKFEEIPKSTRPVRVAFKDFRKWLRSCRPVKALEHLLMGKGKRARLKQNWGPISQMKANAAMKATVDSDEESRLSQSIKTFNTDLKLLDQKKMDHAKLKLENDVFRERYKTILVIADGDLTSARRDLPQGLVIALPSATPDGDPQCVRLNSGSLRVRKNDAKQLAEIFKNSSAYKQYNQSKNRVYQLKTEREELKTSLSVQSKNFEKTHKGLIGERVKADKQRYDAENKQQEAIATQELKVAEARYTKEINDKIQIEVEKEGFLIGEITDLEKKIDSLKDNVASNKKELRKHDVALKYADTGEKSLVEDFIPKILNREGIVDAKMARSRLIGIIDQNQIKLVGLNTQLEGKQDALKAARKAEKVLQTEKDRELAASVKLRNKLKKEFDDVAVKKRKSIDKEAKAERKEAVGMVSGSGSKEKTKARKVAGLGQSVQRDDDDVSLLGLGEDLPAVSDSDLIDLSGSGDRTDKGFDEFARSRAGNK